MREYSFTKGLSKGFLSILIMSSSMVAFAGFSDVTIWGLLENYLQPIVGSLTVGTVLAMAINYIKIKNQL